MYLTLNCISKSYGDKIALNGFSCEFSPGIYALLGPNGSGKTTLMNIIVGNLKQDSGNIYYYDTDVSEKKIASGKDYRQLLGYMPQYSNMYDDFTLFRFMWYIANLKDIGNHLSGNSRKEYIKSGIFKILNAVELDNVAHAKICTLSGGMKQRLCLAQALLGNPRIIVLDEPTAGLDPQQRIMIRTLISKFALESIVIIATHIVSDIENIAREFIFIKKGVIVAKDEKQPLLDKIKDKVWNVRCGASELERYSTEFNVVNIIQNENDENLALKIISDTRPDSSAISIEPTLEDYYLYVFKCLT